MSIKWKKFVKSKQTFIVQFKGLRNEHSEVMKNLARPIYKGEIKYVNQC